MIQMDDLTNEKWYSLCNKEVADGFESLSRSEKVWLTTRGLIDSIEGGGLISYFYNYGADHWQDCLMSLELLHAIEIKSHVVKVANLFVGGVPASIDARNSQIESWEDGEHDSLLESVDKTLMPLMHGLELKLSQFISENGLAT